MSLYIVMGLLSAFLQSFGSRYFQTVIDNFTNGTLTAASILIYGSAIIAQYLIGYLLNYPSQKLEHGIGLSLKTIALKKMSVIDYLSYVKIGTGTLIQRIENGAAAGTNILFGFYLRLASELLPEMLFSIAAIFAINRTVMLSILAGYVVVFVVTNLLLKVLYKVKANILVNEEKLNHVLVRGFMELVVFRVNRRFAHEIGRTEAASDTIVSSKVKMKLIHEAFFTVFAVLVGFVKIGIIVYGWTTGKLTIGEIVALIALVEGAYGPIAIFNVIYVDYRLDQVAFARYTDFLEAEEDNHLTQGILFLKTGGDLSFSGVDFGYGEREIFHNLNLDIARGERVAFVGESGSGKSTAVKLLVGLLHPCSGSVRVSGLDLDMVELDSYYKHIAYLPQEPAIFDGTVRENLVFDDRIRDGALILAMKKVGLEGLYAKLEGGLDTPLGEKGISLSGGERQQLALARLWFTDADVIILDEATSAIDNLTEEAVMKNVMDVLSGRTVIAVAHRLDFVRSFDRIIVFQDGRVVEEGGFDALIRRHRHFYELYNRTTA